MPQTKSPHAWRQLGWFVGLWAASVGAVGLVSLLIRAWLA